MMKFQTAFVAFLLVLLSSCSKENVKDNNYFRFNLSQNIETLEPVMSNSTQTIWALSQIMEGLVQYDKQNQLIPCIAESWTISDDGLLYTFKLRNDVAFHDDPCFSGSGGKGRRVTAGDFKYCLERVNNPKTKSRGMWVYREKIKGAIEYIDFLSGKGGSSVTEISGIRAVNDSILTIELVKPFSPFLSTLTMTYGYVYPKEAVDFYGDRFGQNPVGSGPFRFVKWDFDREIELQRNPSYWAKDPQGASLPYLNGVRITFTQSSETEFLDFQNGKYDYHDPSSETYDQITDRSGKLLESDSKNYTLIKQPWLQTVFFGMMQSPDLPGGKEGPFVGNRKLRQALNYAVDRDRILNFVLKNRGRSAVNGPVPPGMPGFDSTVRGYSFDRDKALKLLEEAGYPDGKGLNLTLVTGNEEIQKTIAIAVQEQFKSLGIDLKLEQLVQATLISKQEEGVFPFWRASWGADYFDPENFMALFYSKNITPKGPNRVGYSNPKMDELYEKALTLNDFAERKKVYDEMQKIAIEDAAWLFLYYNEKVYLLKKDIEGFYLDGLNIINLKYTRKK